MTNLGIGVMIQQLWGDYGQEVYQQSLGKIIKDCKIDNNSLMFKFDDLTRIKFFDNGQSCCEARWMHTDDRPEDFIDTIFNGIEVREGPDETSEYGEPKESQFLIVNTSQGQFTVVNYNEHNGYYGGFALVCHSMEKSQ